MADHNPDEFDAENIMQVCSQFYYLFYFATVSKSSA